MKFAFPLTCGAFVGVNLFGCGGGGGGGATTTKSGDTTTKSGDTTTQSGDTTTTQSGDTTTTQSGDTTTMATTTRTPKSTTTTTTTTPLPPRDGQDVANIMNKEYYGYKPGDKSSPIGNYIRVMPGTDLDITPGGDKWDQCYNGGPVGRVSGSIFNSRQMYCTNDPNKKNHVSGWWGYNKGLGFAGYYVNSTLVLSKLAKCTYAWDGASTGKVNGGCGDIQGALSPHVKTGSPACDEKLHPESPFFNKVPPDYTETSNAESSNVKPRWCPEYKAHSGHDLPADGTGHQCFWKGVAFDTTQGKDTEDESHMMLDRRVAHTKKDSGGDHGPAIEAWNEMVLDGARLQDALRMDPAGTVVAVVYGGKDDWSAGQHKGKAQSLARHMQKKYKLSAPIPVIQVDATVDTQSGEQAPVWLFKEDNQPKSVIVV